MSKELRTDIGLLDSITSSHDAVTGASFLRAKVSIAKAGVFPYLHSNGKTLQEAKLPEELFSKATLDSLKGIPVTNEHPPVGDNNGLVNTTNFSRYVKGSLGEIVVLDGDHIVTTETIYDSELISALQRGEKREVSIGFETDVEYVSGEYNGKRYDAVQRNIRINHLAHVEKGRGGESVRVHLDSNDLNDLKQNFAIMQGVEMKIRIDGKDIEVSEDVFKEIEGLKTKLDGLQAEKSQLEKNPLIPLGKGNVKGDVADALPQPAGNVTQLELQVKTLTELIDKLKAELDATKANEPAKLDSLVNEKIQVLDTARSVIPNFRGDGLTTRELKLQVIGNLLPFKEGVKLDSVTDMEVDMRYDAALNLAREKALLQPTTTEPRVDSFSIEKLKAQRLNLNKEVA